MDMYTQLGDVLAMQYGGSETNKRVATETQDAATQVRGGFMTHMCDGRARAV
jgi:hypothetical protein